jgi:hypothetical protein
MQTSARRAHETNGEHPHRTQRRVRGGTLAAPLIWADSEQVLRAGDSEKAV